MSYTAEQRNPNRFGGATDKDRKRSYNDWLKDHPEIKNDNTRPDIDAVGLPFVHFMRYQTDNGKKPFFTVEYENSLGQTVTLTTRQACALDILHTSLEYSLAERGETNRWAAARNRGVEIDDPQENWQALLYQLIPEAECHCGDDFFNTLAEESNDFKAMIKELLRDKRHCEKLFFVNLIRKYEKIEKCDDLTEEELESIAEESYQEAMEYYHYQTFPEYKRIAINRRAAKAFQKKSGYKYVGSFFNVFEDTWIDENTLELLPLFIPEFHAKLQEMKKIVVPNSQIGKQILKCSVKSLDEKATNPLNFSTTLGNTAENTLKNFDRIFMISEEQEEDSGGIYNQIYEAIATINEYRGVRYGGGCAFGDEDQMTDMYDKNENEVISGIAILLTAYRRNLEINC